MGIVAMLVIVVMLLVYAYYLVVVRARKQGGHEEERNELAQHSVYAMHAQTVNRRELGTVSERRRPCHILMRGTPNPLSPGCWRCVSMCRHS